MNELKTFLYLLVLNLSFTLGWFSALAGYRETKWVAAPAFVFILGAIVRMFWMKP